jgi:histidyl-tRNA synthetase
MAQQISSPRGTADVLPEESYKWRYVEGKLADICARFGYREIRLPTFEYTELFERGVGETTDVVGKEMYTMLDKAGRSITLRPEGTANTARAFLQHGLLSGPLPVRGFYLMSCFRYEKPQSGRLREFHQLGIELFGAPGPDADAEVIRVGDTVLREMGIKNIRLEINSIGCPKCRKEYHAALKAYFENHKGKLCETCLDRLVRNPLRILDCKSPVCADIAKDSPIVTDYLCDECSDHFDRVKNLLTASGIKYEINPRIVRGLDYYSKTVFEFIHEAAGAQGTVCGGGRYDGLVELLDGPAMPGVGFGMGLERLLAVMEAEGTVISEPYVCPLFICYIGEKGQSKARELVFELQRKGVAAMYDINARSLKAQLKFADKIGAQYTLVLGDDEVATSKAELRNMADSTTKIVEIDVEMLAALF